MRRVGAFLLGALVAWAAAARETPPPEGATGFEAKPAVAASRFIVVAANPIAADTGHEILARGGSAVDAAIAVQLVLNLVEPQSSGIGGGGFLLHYSAAEARVRAYDGRETAPRAAKPDRFMGMFGRPKGFYEAVLSGRSVGVPGLLRLLELAHRHHGRLPWADLFAPAIALAEGGFPVSPRLHALLDRDPFLARDPAARRLYFDAQGRPKPPGTVIRNPELAGVLREVAARGADAFYTGPIAREIARAVTSNPVEAGDLTVADLAAYRAREREPVCGPYRTWRICGVGPPSAGGVAVLQILGILERLPATDFSADPLMAVHRFSEAGRLAYADRDRYVADPEFASVPVGGLLAPDYLAGRARLVSDLRSAGRAQPGRPARAPLRADGVVIERAGTTHVSIVDANGDAVALTSSIEFAFGNHRVVRGFILNNQLTDFSPVAQESGRLVANRVEGGKRPRSAMSPTFVFDESGRLYAIAGSPGGQSIVNFVARTLVALLDWKLPPDAAVALPHFGSRNGPTELEAGTALDSLRKPLEALGHDVRVREMTSGLSVVVRDGDRWVGAADPRREGAARGE